MPGWNDLLRLKGSRSIHPYNSTKRKWHAIVATAAIAARVRSVERAVFSFEWREKSARRNPDNLTAGVKFILDALVEIGILRNDGWGEVAGLVHQFPRPAYAAPGVLVTMESTEDDGHL